jgi:hypothetical protein
MLVSEDGDGVRLIGQASHAWLSGQLARAWGNDRFPPPSPREEVCLAAVQHDIGMMEWDLRPTLNADTGLPDSFLEMPLALHLELWTAAPAKLLSQSRYAALLVSMHGTALYARRDLSALDPADADRVRHYLAGERALQAKLTEQLAVNPAERNRNQRLIWTWDGISLAICLPWKKLTFTDVPTCDGSTDIAFGQTAPDRFTLAPWPFATDTVELQVEARRLSGRFGSALDLHQALDDAPSRVLHFTLHH